MSGGVGPSTTAVVLQLNYSGGVENTIRTVVIGLIFMCFA